MKLNFHKSSSELIENASGTKEEGGRKKRTFQTQFIFTMVSNFWGTLRCLSDIILLKCVLSAVQ